MLTHARFYEVLACCPEVQETFFCSFFLAVGGFGVLSGWWEGLPAVSSWK